MPVGLSGCCETVLRLPAPPLVPGTTAVIEHLALDPVPASVSIARKFVHDVLGDVDVDVVDSVLLLSSELVTNAILYAHTPVQVGIVVDDGHALVCVADRLPDAPPALRDHSPGKPNDGGLSLVNDRSEQWGATSFPGGKTVWFTMSLTPSAARLAEQPLAPDQAQPGQPVRVG
jgi:anti-sigma regulatory factor (Ser/Thr protein kinase)